MIVVSLFIAGTMRVLQRGGKGKKGKKGPTYAAAGGEANDCAPISRTTFGQFGPFSPAFLFSKWCLLCIFSFIKNHSDEQCESLSKL